MPLSLCVCVCCSTHFGVQQEEKEGYGDRHAFKANKKFINI